ncbi:MAG: ComF family protein [Termitinemataceae bacterium]|nr:MAG: ComF family protein [Termitinemataceae bacterium]
MKKLNFDSPKLRHCFRGALEAFCKIGREFLFPLGCPICGKNLTSYSDLHFGICADCVRVFVIDSSPRCDVCGKPLISEIGTCLKCRETRETEEIPTRCFVIYPYIGEYKQLIQAYKFGAHRNLKLFFADRLLQAASQMRPEFDFDECAWVPVPPRHRKIHDSGWDQIEAIAAVLEGTYKKNVVRPLKRLKSESQKKLGRSERKTNLSGKIICCKKPPANIILFDDVYTTGSTIQTCAAALKEAGAQNVFAICLCYD